MTTIAKKPGSVNERFGVHAGLVDQRVRMVIEIMNEESEATGLSSSIIKDVLSGS